jgi:hypothetical protein
VLATYAFQQRSVEVFAVGFLVALGTSAAAAVGGFLFGLPRYNAVLAVPVSGASTAAESSMSAADEARATAGIYTPSNNLEQVSDWLTKLLLGAGLVQLGRIGRWFSKFIDGLAAAFVGQTGQATLATARTIAGSLIVFYAAFGFLFGYIITTLWYRQRLEGE